MSDALARHYERLAEIKGRLERQVEALTNEVRGLDRAIAVLNECVTDDQSEGER